MVQLSVISVYVRTLVAPKDSEDGVDKHTVESVVLCSLQVVHSVSEYSH